MRATLSGTAPRLILLYRESAETKKAEAARKKAEKDALLREEEASLPTKAKSGNAKTAQKKTNRGLDLSQLDSSSTDAKGAVLNASGIDNALDALSLTNKSADSSKVDRHPERRFKAAYAAFEEKRLPEVEQEQPGLRRNQRVEVVRKEFEKSPDNPFNQVRAAYDATKEDVQTIRGAEKGKIEQRLGGEGN